MSTIPIIVKHEDDTGLLRRFRPIMRGREREVRQLTVISDMHEWLYEPEPSRLRKAKGGIRGHLGEFVRGERVDDLYFMKRVEDRRRPSQQFSHGVWAISERLDEPQFRLFGLFAITNWFVVLTKQSRDQLNQGDAHWHTEIDRCLELWNALFPGRVPWVRDTLEEFVSRYAEKLDDRW